MRKYNNYRVFIESKGGSVMTRPDEFKTTIEFKCENGHERTLTVDSFKNFKGNVDKGRVPFCGSCQSTQDLDKIIDKMSESVSEMLKTVGHTLIEYVNNKEVRYRCGKCNEETKSTVSNLKKSKGTCGHCQNVSQRKSKEDVRKELAEYGLELMGEYTNNKSIPVRCVCGFEYVTALNDVKRGRRCNQCASTRRTQTNIQKYGVQNVAHAPDFKDKCIQTNQLKRGVNHHMQDKQVLEQAKSTNLSRYGVPFAFNQPEVYAKIKRLHFQRHGVEYPLQRAEIQRKIEETCMRNMGVRRPLMSKEHRDKITAIIQEKYGADQFLQSEEGKRMMMEKYGQEYFVQSDMYKEMMLEKYGQECFLHSNEYKDIMITRYGVEHPTQNPDILRRAIASAFRYKDYAFPSGRVERVMGYEDRAIDYLLTTIEEDKIQVRDIPIIDYEYDGVKRRYFADLYIPSLNCLVEVKSPWTLCIDLDKNLSKFDAVHHAGYTMKVIVINGEGELIESELEFD